MKALCDKAMDKVVRVGRILMKRPGVMVHDDIVLTCSPRLLVRVNLLLPVILLARSLAGTLLHSNCVVKTNFDSFEQKTLFI
jgi:hypothetical protein